MSTFASDTTFNRNCYNASLKDKAEGTSKTSQIEYFTLASGSFQVVLAVSSVVSLSDAWQGFASSLSRLRVGIVDLHSFYFFRVLYIEYGLGVN